MWSGLLIAIILHEVCPRYQITNAVVLAPGEAILFFGRHSFMEGLLYRYAQDIKVGLRDPVSWTGKNAWVKVTMHTKQEGYQATVYTITEKKMQARGPGDP